MDLTFQVPMQYCSLQHLTLFLSPVTSTAGYCFCYGSIPSFFLELFLHWSPVTYWAPYQPWEFLFQYPIILPFHTVHGILKASLVQFFATPWTTACQASLSITNSPSLPKPLSVELVMPSNHLIFYCPLVLLPSIFPSIRVFSNESVLHIRWPKFWSFSFNISPSNDQPGLIFRMDWLGLLAVQGTLNSLLQHHSSKASVLRSSAFFIGQLSHPYMTTEKTLALTIWTLVGKVMSLLLNVLSRIVIAFLPRSKRLLISWLQSPSAMILEPKKIKPITVFTFSPSICHEVMGLDAMILVFCMLNVKLAFPLSSFTLIKRLFSSSSLCAIRVVSYAYLKLLIFLAAILKLMSHPVQHFAWCTMHII